MTEKNRRSFQLDFWWIKVKADGLGWKWTVTKVDCQKNRKRKVHNDLTVSVRNENFATVRLGFPEPNILIQWTQYFQVKIRHAYIILYDAKVMSQWRKNLISGSFPEYSNYKNLFPVLAYTTKRCKIKFERGSCGDFLTFEVHMYLKSRF